MCNVLLRRSKQKPYCLFHCISFVLHDNNTRNNARIQNSSWVAFTRRSLPSSRILANLQFLAYLGKHFYTELRDVLDTASIVVTPKTREATGCILSSPLSCQIRISCLRL